MGCIFFGLKRPLLSRKETLTSPFMAESMSSLQNIPRCINKKCCNLFRFLNQNMKSLPLKLVFRVHAGISLLLEEEMFSNFPQRGVIIQVKSLLCRETRARNHVTCLEISANHHVDAADHLFIFKEVA